MSVYSIWTYHVSTCQFAFLSCPHLERTKGGKANEGRGESRRTAKSVKHVRYRLRKPPAREASEFTRTSPGAWTPQSRYDPLSHDPLRPFCNPILHQRVNLRYHVQRNESWEVGRLDDPIPTGVWGKNYPREKKTLWTFSLKNTTSGAGEQFLL